jgi:hypothetical protein
MLFEHLGRLRTLEREADLRHHAAHWITLERPIGHDLIREVLEPPLPALEERLAAELGFTRLERIPKPERALSELAARNRCAASGSPRMAPAAPAAAFSRSFAK